MKNSDRIVLTEDSILGALLNAPRLVEDVKNVLRPEIFTQKKSRVLYESMLRHNETDNDKWDYLTLAQSLTEKETEEAGGIVEIGRLLGESPTSEPSIIFEYIGYLVKEKARRDMSSILIAAQDEGERDFDEVLTEAANKLEELKEHTTIAAKVRGLLEPPTKEQFMSLMSTAKPSLSTQYSFGRSDKATRLMLPAGALTYIGAQTSHGKSRFLQNLALYQVQQELDNEGSARVLYFSLEEDLQSTAIEFLNLYANEILSENNTETMRSIFSGNKREFGETTKLLDKTSVLEFSQKSDEFWGSIIETGLLAINAKVWECSELIRAIRYAVKKDRIKAIFIDYVQLLKKAGRFCDRKDELSSICVDLMDCAKSVGVPIVLGAQLNRVPQSPVDLTPQCMADASNIEHSANVIVLLWNLEKAPLYNERWQYTLEALKAQEIDYPANDGNLIGILAKNRNGRVGGWERFHFDGNTGKIYGNCQKVDEQGNQLPIDGKPYSRRRTQENDDCIPF